jgi:amidase
MPTLPSPPCKLFDNPSDHGPLERLSRNVGLVGNTAPFNSTGHPALTIPVGFVPAAEDKNVKLPAGLQIVGRKFEDIECLKVGAAWEKAYDWKKL